MQLRPSSSHMWTQCFAQPRFAALSPEEPEGDPSREGTCAAWVAEMVLKGEVKKAADLEGTTHANGWLVTADMIDHIHEYVMNVMGHGGTVHTERKVRLNTLIAGTPDAYAILSKEGVLYVDDLKYGFMIVEPYRNPQISIYAGAILRRLTVNGVTVNRVVIGVYQPRGFHPAGVYRTWEVYPEDLMKFVHEIEAAGEACQNPAAEATPGSHCEYCPAAAHCVALGFTTYRNFDAIRDSRHAVMTPEALSAELEFLDVSEKMLKARRSAIRAESVARMKNGEIVPGWHLERPLGDRQFKVDEMTIRALTGKDPYKPREMKSPAMLEKEGVKPVVVNALSTRPMRPPTLKKLPKDYYNQLFTAKGS